MTRDGPENRPIEAEFSRLVEASAIGLEPITLTIEAEAGERVALAERFGLLVIESLGARLHLRRVAQDLVEVSGHFDAKVVQECVVSLEPVPAVLAEDFIVSYSEHPEAPSDATVELSLDDDDRPELIIGGQIDVGEAVAQQLSLALDPYPRAPGATFVAVDEEGGEAPARSSPFADLAEMVRSGRSGRGR
jgi:uncharacterized metal-binding protein YceD (DUF177 family)